MANRMAISIAMEATPPLSHARVWALRKNTSGHQVSVWNDGQRVWFIDSQTSRVSTFIQGRHWVFDLHTGKWQLGDDSGYSGFKVLLSDF